MEIVWNAGLPDRLAARQLEAWLEETSADWHFCSCPHHGDPDSEGTVHPAAATAPRLPLTLCGHHHVPSRPHSFIITLSSHWTQCSPHHEAVLTLPDVVAGGGWGGPSARTHLCVLTALLSLKRRLFLATFQLSQKKIQ